MDSSRTFNVGPPKDNGRISVRMLPEGSPNIAY
jgi:hypothetical protein